MTPSDLQAARKECHDLLRQGLIEPTQSNWACQAFYVEKRAEKLRGKKRLVIDYKPLNHFLKDDKFLIPKVSSLPTLIRESNLFSKFDLKSGFWQLGLKPEDRYKTNPLILFTFQINGHTQNKKFSNPKIIPYQNLSLVHLCWYETPLKSWWKKRQHCHQQQHHRKTKPELRWIPAESPAPGSSSRRA